MNQDDTDGKIGVIRSVFAGSLFAGLLVISVLILYTLSFPFPVQSKDNFKTLNTENTVVGDNSSQTFLFIEEDLIELEEQKIAQLEEEERQRQEEQKRREEEERRRFLQSTVQSPSYYENLIIQKCAQFGCNATQVIRVMYCESTANPLATNGIYQGLFQHLNSAWPQRASTYGVPGANIFSGDAQVHVTAQMFANGLGYLWGCQ